MNDSLGRVTNFLNQDDVISAYNLQEMVTTMQKVKLLYIYIYIYIK